MKRTFSQANKANDSSSEDDGLIFFSKDEVEKQGRAYVKMPKKTNHRMHAHINPFNPLSIAFPINASYVDWS